MRVPENNWFHPGRAVMSDSARAAIRLTNGAILEDVRITARDSTQLYGLLVRTPGARVTVLYFGGDNFRVARGGAAVAEAISSHGANALIMDYRGYGQSAGRPSLIALKQDAIDAFDHLRRYPAAANTRVVVHGYSMGSFVAAHLATERAVDGLVLESTATNVPDWARGMVPWYAKPFVRIKLAEALKAESNIARLQHYHGPLLLVVGANDRITRPGMSRELYRISATPSSMRHLVVVPGAGHGDALENAQAVERYRAFLASIR